MQDEQVSCPVVKNAKLLWCPVKHEEFEIMLSMLIPKPLGVQRAPVPVLLRHRAAPERAEQKKEGGVSTHQLQIYAEQ